MAIDYGRDVFALPGRIDDECSTGCNNLIKRQKAQMIESADDLISCMQWQGKTNHDTQTRMPSLLADLSVQQERLYQILQEAEDGIHINQLVIESQLAYNIVASELVMMELQDLVKSMPGGMWRVKK